MREIKEIEKIAPRYYNLLNDYIRIGKRTLSQKKNVLEPLKKRADEILHTLADNFCKHSTGIFKIYNNSAAYVDLKIECKPETWEGIGFLRDINLEGAYSFKEMFKDIIDLLNTSYYLRITYLKEQSPAKVLAELYELIEEIRKENIMLFFKYIKTKEALNKIKELLAKKEKLLDQKLDTIRDIWDRDTLPKPGMPITYATSDYTQREGIVVKYSDNGREVYIKTKGNKTIKRGLQFTSWSNKFHNTDLYYGMRLLRHKIPEVWKEKRLEFYS